MAFFEYWRRDTGKLGQTKDEERKQTRVGWSGEDDGAGAGTKQPAGDRLNG